MPTNPEPVQKGSAGKIGISLLGNPARLFMADNLLAAELAIKSDQPAFRPVCIFGCCITGEGCINLTNKGNYFARWVYGFVNLHDNSFPATWASVSYLGMGGNPQVLLDWNAGNLSQKVPIQEDLWRHIPDSNDILLHLNAGGIGRHFYEPKGTNSDSIAIQMNQANLQIHITNWKGQIAQLGVNPLHVIRLS